MRAMINQCQMLSDFMPMELLYERAFSRVA